MAPGGRHALACKNNSHGKNSVLVHVFTNIYIYIKLYSTPQWFFFSVYVYM